MSKKAKLKVAFYGGAQLVTGVNHFLEGVSPEGNTTRVLIDCGLFQGSRTSEKRNQDDFSYDPTSIDALFVTHAHLDHVGRIPKLIKDGFRGKIYSTPPTRDFARIILNDSLGILTRESRHHAEEPIYRKEDVEGAMNRWEVVDYYEGIQLGDFNVAFREAGHILGSSMIEFEFEGKKVLFSGDLGNPPNPILRDADKIGNVDYLIIESTYGDRSHDHSSVALKLERAIEDAVHKGGVLMIPAFSLERTQKLLFDINNLIENGRIPKVPIFLDSPLAIKATKIYKKYKSYYNEKAREIVHSGDDLFNFPGLKMTLETSESKKINNVPAPKIIIAGSGMSTGGRIIHHERRYLPDAKSTLLLVGYQSAGSLGRRLVERAKNVSILGEDVTVRASTVVLSGYSAHADMDDLFSLVQSGSDRLKKVFAVQGEPKSSMFFAQRLRDYLGLDTVVPEIGQSFDLEL